MPESDKADEIIRKNRHGVEKEYVQVEIGTSVAEVPRHLTNPLTDRRHDLTELSDDGYLKAFLALEYASNSPDVVDFGSAPVATFDKDRWEMQEREGTYILVKREAESKFGGMVLDGPHPDAGGGS